VDLLEWKREDAFGAERGDAWKNGWKEGWKDGWEEGRKEIVREVAKNCLGAGMNRITIAKTTGLSMETVQEIAAARGAYTGGTYLGLLDWNLKDALEGEREEAWKKGWKEGWKEGWEEGRKEIVREIAKNCLGVGVNQAIIVQATGLPMETVQEIAAACGAYTGGTSVDLSDKNLEAGKEKAWEDSREERAREVAKSLLSLDLNPAAVAQITELPIETIREIAAAEE
jgi:predicted transposase YdaD